MLNDIDLNGLDSYIKKIGTDPSEAISSYGISAVWQGGVTTKVTTGNQWVGSAEVEKNFSFTVGEPKELLGDNQHPTPQDYLLGGLAGCMMVGFVIVASQKGISLEYVALTITGSLDLKGMLELDSSSPIGFDRLQFNFEVQGNGNQKEYDAIIEQVRRLSPNYRTIADTVTITQV